MSLVSVNQALFRVMQRYFGSEKWLMPVSHLRPQQRQKRHQGNAKNANVLLHQYEQQNNYVGGKFWYKQNDRRKKDVSYILQQEYENHEHFYGLLL